MKSLALSLCLFAAGFISPLSAAPLTPPAPESAAQVLDLATEDGVRAVKGQWRYSDTRIIEAPFRAAGPDGQPGTTEVVTYDVTPHAGTADYDDSQWLNIAPSELSTRRGNGRLSFAWYRIRITVPDRIGDFETKGSSLVFDTAIDDYAEVWVNGEIARTLGQNGGSVVAGWNASNRVVIGTNLKPGQQIQLAVFGANGPLSNPPTNYIWMRHARLEFHRSGPTGPYAITPAEVNVEVERKDPAIDRLIPRNAKLYKLAEGFTFTEGPIWVDSGNYLLFSDPNENRIYKYSDGQLSVFREKSGYEGADVAEYGQPGSNGLTLDPRGRLTINQHGNRRVIRVEQDGRDTVLADRYQGKRLNSPNDLVYRSDGTLFFTDPPFGLPKFSDDPRKELPYSGVYAIYKGELTLLTTDFTGPNGIAFSPDEKYLYVTNWDDKKKWIMRYDVQPDASLKNGKLFFDMTSAKGEDALDGMKVDVLGNLYVSGPGGLWIISPEGKHLGTIFAPMHPHNLAWGDADRNTLYLAAKTGLYRIRLNVAGAGGFGSDKTAH